MAADASSAPVVRPRLSGKKTLLLALVVLIVTIVPAVVVPTLFFRPDPPELPVIGEIPELAFIDDHGKPLGRADLLGHVTIVNFIFTRCAAACPAMTMRMARIQDATFDLAPVKLLSISVDPAHDTPAVLRAYADDFRANPTRWRFATGDPATVKATVEGPFMTAMEVREVPGQTAIDVAHGEHFLLIDRQGRIRDAYDSKDPKRMAALEQHARYLANHPNR